MSVFAPPVSRDTEYDRYLRTEELLALQKPAAERAHSDELMFQVIHQVEELWMKLMVHELSAAAESMDSDNFVSAHKHLARYNQTADLLEAQLRLFQTMQPDAYLAIRRALGHGSGMDSPGFQHINAAAPELGARFHAALARHTVDLVELYEKPQTHLGLLQLAEDLITLDAAMQRFKREHILVVRRIIGIGTASLRGNPVDMLERSAQKTFYPLLWAVRERLFAEFRAGDPVVTSSAD